MSNADLLPPNATPQESALAGAVSRLSSVPVPVRDLWNPDTCPDDKLAWLAWAFSVDEWDQLWSNEAKRASIRDAMAVQRIKGTVSSIRRVLANAGYGQADIREGASNRMRNGAIVRDGAERHGDTAQWARYRVILNRPMTNDQAAQVRRILAATAPARCQLEGLVYIQANNAHNGKITRNGTFNRGIA